MKRSLVTLAAMAAATPALAHVDGGYHTHGSEYLLIVALVAAGITAAILNK
jgi:hypothetical protein